METILFPPTPTPHPLRDSAGVTSSRLSLKSVLYSPTTAASTGWNGTRLKWISLVRLVTELR